MDALSIFRLCTVRYLSTAKSSVVVQLTVDPRPGWVQAQGSLRGRKARCCGSHQG